MRSFNYDLGILQDYVERNNIPKVVVALRDSEGFDVSLIAELVHILR